MCSSPGATLRRMLFFSWLLILAGISGCRNFVSDGGKLDLPQQSSSASAGQDTEGDETRSATADAPAANSSSSGARAPKVATVLEEESDMAIYEPIIHLSEGHAATCLVKVGDAMPPLVLRDLAGAEQSLADFRGEKLTIVVFWTARLALARELFQRLAAIAADRYSGQGVNVVAVNVGDDPQTVNELYEKYGGSFPCLLDTQAEAFGQVATEILPRVYLLDNTGRIVWLDMENSRSMRRGLHNAVRFYLDTAALAE